MWNSCTIHFRSARAAVSTSGLGTTKSGSPTGLPSFAKATPQRMLIRLSLRRSSSRGKGQALASTSANALAAFVNAIVSNPLAICWVKSRPARTRPSSRPPLVRHPRSPKRRLLRRFEFSLDQATYFCIVA